MDRYYWESKIHYIKNTFKDCYIQKVNNTKIDPEKKISE